MRFLSLFSGIEAASAAWKPLGWECSAVAEVEPFPCAVLAHHYPEVPNLGDVTKITADQIKALGHIDLVCGGFPCQDLSVAGKRKGLQNEDGSATRSGLFFDAMRIAEWAKPRWLFIENVPGMFSSNGGADFAAVVGEMAGCEFDVPRDGWRNAGVVAGPKGLVEWAVLDAQYHGLAQRRRRVFLVRDSGDWHSRPPIFLEQYRLSGHPAPSRKAGKAAPTIPSRSTAGGGLGTDFDCDGGVITMDHGQGGAEIGFDRCPTLTCNHEAPYVAHSLRGEGFDASEDGTGRGAYLAPQPVITMDHGQGGAANALLTPNGGRDGLGVGAIAFQPGNLARGAGAGPSTKVFPTLKSDNGRGQSDQDPHVAVATPINTQMATRGPETSNSSREGLSLGKPGDPAFTLQAAHHHAVQVAMQVRRLTPTEAERLMGFPDNYTAIPWRKKPASECPDGQRYKALGNSWAVPVAAWIGQRIEAVEALQQLKQEAA